MGDNIIRKDNYYVYKNGSSNMGFFEICFNLDKGLFIRPVRYIQQYVGNESLGDYRVDYSNLYGEYAVKFLSEVLGYSKKISKKRYDKLYNDWLTSFRKTANDITSLI